jgi:hypothetical protein
MEDESKLLWIGQYILDEQGNAHPEYDFLTWAKWMEGPARQLACTQFAWGRVSTIFLGLDHDFLPMEDPLNYKPILWETMVFGGPLDMAQTRYRSQEEALAGHRAMVERCIEEQENSEDKFYVERMTETAKE